MALALRLAGLCERFLERFAKSKSAGIDWNPWVFLPISCTADRAYLVQDSLVCDPHSDDQETPPGSAKFSMLLGERARCLRLGRGAERLHGGDLQYVLDDARPAIASVGGRVNSEVEPHRPG